MQKISTEDAISEQWRMLERYSYPSNIIKYMTGIGHANVADITQDIVAGSIRQSKAYFDAAGQAPLDISPLLLYYGATNLLLAANVLLTNSIPPIENHGMVMPKQTATRLADVEIRPVNSQSGALQLHANIFSSGCILCTGATWTLGDVLGSVPDLRFDFENQYDDLLYFCTPVEVVKLKDRSLERIVKQHLDRYPSLEDAIERIPNNKMAYLSPQIKNDYVILLHKFRQKNIGIWSISGQKFLQIGHEKSNAIIAPNQIILSLMGLYILGFLPRYRPDLWNPFVRSDTTGEKYVIEKFMHICRRYLPNLVLNVLLGERLQFVNEADTILDLTKVVSNDDIAAVVRDTIRELRATGEI